MELDINEIDDVAIVDVSGEIDFYSALNLKNSLSEAVEKGNVIVNLKAVTFIDSAGLGALTKAMKTATSIGFKLVLSNINIDIKNLMRLSTLDMFFDIHETVEDALKSMKK